MGGQSCDAVGRKVVAPGFSRDELPFTHSILMNVSKYGFLLTYRCIYIRLKT